MAVKIREYIRWVGHAAHMKEMKKALNMTVIKREGKRQLERPEHTCKDNIKIDLKEIGYEDVDWIQGAQKRDQVCELA